MNLNESLIESRIDGANAENEIVDHTGINSPNMFKVELYTNSPKIEKDIVIRGRVSSPSINTNKPCEMAPTVSKKRPLEVNLEGPLFSYIGETSRSAYERGLEHLKDLEFRRVKSHYLRHAVEFHPNIPPESLDFRMKVLSSHKTAFERQIREAVIIDMESGPYLMNSKIEYSRCLLPKMSIKLGNKSAKEDPLVTKEKDIREKIQLLYKNENKRAAEGGNIRNKRARIEVPENLSPKSPKVKLDNVVEIDKKFEKAKKATRSKKVPRSEIKLKLTPKKSPVSKVGARNGSPNPNLNTEIGSPDPDLISKIGSTSPDLRTEIGSPDPNMKSDEVEMGQKDNIGLIHSEKVVDCPKAHPRMIDSPSLKPVKIRNLIKSFEDNIKSENGHASGSRMKKMDVFETLMMSGGDAPKRTPKKKPKRLKTLNTNKNEASSLDKWLKKFKEN